MHLSIGSMKTVSNKVSSTSLIQMRKVNNKLMKKRDDAHLYTVISYMYASLIKVLTCSKVDPVCT